MQARTEQAGHRHEAAPEGDELASVETRERVEQGLQAPQGEPGALHVAHVGDETLAQPLESDQLYAPSSADRYSDDVRLPASGAATFSAVSAWDEIDELNEIDEVGESDAYQHLLQGAEHGEAAAQEMPRVPPLPGHYVVQAPPSLLPSGPALHSMPPGPNAFDAFEEMRASARPVWPVLLPTIVCALALVAGAAHYISAEAEQQARVERTLREIHRASAEAGPAAATDKTPETVALPNAEAPRSETLAAFMRLGSTHEERPKVAVRGAPAAPVRHDLTGTRALPWVRTKYELRNGTLASRSSKEPERKFDWVDSRGPSSDWANAPRAFQQATDPTPARQREETARSPKQQHTPRSSQQNDDAPNPTDDPLFGL